jgi:hypothetical protein
MMMRLIIEETQIKLHLHPMPDDPSLVALMFGPLVLAGQLNAVDLPDEEIYGKYGPTVDPILIPYFAPKRDNLDSWIKPVEKGLLKFHTVEAGIPCDVTLIPFCQMFGHRYAI